MDPIDQPVQFDHRHHVGDEGIDLPLLPLPGGEVAGSGRASDVGLPQLPRSRSGTRAPSWRRCGRATSPTGPSSGTRSTSCRTSSTSTTPSTCGRASAASPATAASTDGAGGEGAVALTMGWCLSATGSRRGSSGRGTRSPAWTYKPKGDQLAIGRELKDAVPRRYPDELHDMPSLKSLPIAGQQQALAQPGRARRATCAPRASLGPEAPPDDATSRRSVLQLLGALRGARHAGRMPQAAGREDPSVHEAAAGGDAGQSAALRDRFADRRRAPRASGDGQRGPADEDRGQPGASLEPRRRRAPRAGRSPRACTTRSG